MTVSAKSIPRKEPDVMKFERGVYFAQAYGYRWHLQIGTWVLRIGQKFEGYAAKIILFGGPKKWFVYQPSKKCPPF